MAIQTTQQPETTEELGKEVLKLLVRNGPLDLTQIVVETLISENQIVEVRDYLLTKKLIEERPDRGYEKQENDMLKIYGLPRVQIANVLVYLKKN